MDYSTQLNNQPGMDSWVITTLYLSSRMPQRIIVLINKTRKSTTSCVLALDNNHNLCLNVRPVCFNSVFSISKYPATSNRQAKRLMIQLHFTRISYHFPPGAQRNLFILGRNVESREVNWLLGRRDFVVKIPRWLYLPQA